MDSNSRSPLKSEISRPPIANRSVLTLVIVNFSHNIRITAMHRPVPLHTLRGTMVMPLQQERPRAQAHSSRPEGAIEARPADIIEEAARALVVAEAQDVAASRAVTGDPGAAALEQRLASQTMSARTVALLEAAQLLTIMRRP